MFDRLHQHHSSGTFSQLLVIHKLDRISIQVGGEVKVLDQTWEGIKVWTGPFSLGGGYATEKVPSWLVTLAYEDRENGLLLSLSIMEVFKLLNCWSPQRGLKSG